MPISKITGQSIEDGSIVLADLGITTFNTGAGNTLTLQANSATGITIDVTGNTAIANTLSFTGTGARIRGDMSNGTQANRLAFQTSTANSVTAITAIPNGTGTQSSINLFDNSDPTNAGTLNLVSNATEKSVRAAISGTGTYLPLTMYTNGSERLRIDTSGNVGIGVTPAAWGSSFSQKALQLSTTGAISCLDASSGNRQLNLTNNAYFDNTNWRYITNDAATFFRQYQSLYQWYVAPSGTAGDVITWSESMRLDSAGRLGIGTTSPSQKLHVAAGTILSSNTAGTIATVSIAGNGSTVGTSDFALQQGTSSEAYVFNRANSYLVIGTNNTERIRIDTSGNVGIGTTAPQAVLDLGSGTLGRGLTWGGTAGANRYATIFAPYSNGGIVLGASFHGSTSADSYLTSYTGTTYANGIRLNLFDAAGIQFFTDGSASKTAGAAFTPTERMRITSTGLVGIGTSGPAGDFRMTLAGDDTIMPGFVALNNQTATQVSATVYSTSSAGWFGTRTSHPALFITNGTERMRITSAGNVGIGTSSPSTTLDVASSVGTVRVSSTTTTSTTYFTAVNAAGNFYIGRDSSTGGNFGTAYAAVLFSEGAYPMTFYTTSLERMRITSTGNVGIGTTNPGAKLDVIGTTFFRGTAGGRTLNISEGSTSTIGFLIEADTNAGDLTLSSAYSAGFIAFKTAGSERMRITSAGLLQFNSGYGSVATAYGVRAWISFNGSSGAINGSGNVSSVTNNATGDWTINFSTAMPDGNYSIVGMVRSDNDVNPAANPAIRSSDSPGTGSCRVMFGVSNSRIAFTLAMFQIVR